MSYFLKQNTFLSLACVSLFMQTALAENSVSTDIQLPTKKQVSDSKLTGDFGFQSNALVQDVGEVVGNKHFGDLNLNYHSLVDGNVYKKFEVSARVNNEEELMYSFKEAMIEYRYSTSSLYLGRRVLPWSQVDEAWGLGRVNNRVNFDYFEPGQEGLIGIFYDKKFDSGFTMALYGSFIYVPELNPARQIEKDARKVTCKNPWCKPQPDSVEVEGKNVPIYYDVAYPEISDVVFRYSSGLKFGYEKNSFSTDIFYIRKPENSISVIAEITAEADLSQINVEATPQFYYHDVSGANANYNLNDKVSVYGSAISIIPSKFPDGDQPYIEYTGLKPRKIKEEYLSLGTKYTNDDLVTKISYIARVSEFDRKNEALAEYPRWNQAVQFSYGKRITRKVDLFLDYKYDMLTEDRLTMFKANYRFKPSIIGSLGINIIGTNPDEKSYWSDFENNDSVYSSLKYIF